MTGGKRLTPPQSRKVNSLVKKECCNCERGHCILLDDGEECVCPQLISYSLLCKLRNISNHIYMAAASVLFFYNTSIFDMKHTIAPSNVSSSVFKTSNTFSPG